MKKETFRAWAIDTNSDEGQRLIGRYWWFEGAPPVIPASLKGCEIALFSTRLQARKCLPDVLGAFPHARVRRIKVSVSFTEEDKMKKCPYCERLNVANARLIEALKEISEGKGRYSMDKLTHAENTIQDMKEIAKQAITKVETGEDNGK